MIKELNKKTAKTKTGYQFGMIEIKSPILSAIQKDINMSVYDFNTHYKEQLDKIDLIEIKKQKNFKDADWVPIYLYADFWCVSKKFKEIFEGKLKGYWYPTNDENYFIFLLDNCIDAIDKTKTEIKYDEENLHMPCWYEYIENLIFKSEAGKEYIFTIPEWYRRYLATEKFEGLVKDNNLTGFQFYKEINYKRKDGTEFDMLRNKSYDEEGNVI